LEFVSLRRRTMKRSSGSVVRLLLHIPREIADGPTNYVFTSPRVVDVVSFIARRPAVAIVSDVDADVTAAGREADEAMPAAPLISTIFAIGSPTGSSSRALC
jgi:hypothetical protein